ncbi:hypothetical protein [Corynebacterium aurimucosum]|uniref:hypothetical protein n=1 Tax=Corynebacterium aurimucosum TaxID=169292 RepID=UPI003757D48B
MTTTATRPPTFFFSTTNPNNPHAMARAQARRATYKTWVGAMPSLDADINTTALSLKRPGFSSASFTTLC